MSPFLLILVPLAAGALAYRYYSFRRQESPSEIEADEPPSRELLLSRRLAAALGCGVRDVMPAVANEIEIAPHAPDDTILKRAKYHYQQNLPEKTCNVWQDRKAG